MRWQGWAEARAARGLPPLLLESPGYSLHLVEPVQDPLVHLGEVEQACISWAPRTQHGEWGPWAPGRLARASRARVCAASPAHCLSCSTPGPLRSHSSPLARAGPGGTQCAPPQVPVRLTSSRLRSGTSLKVQRLDCALPWQGAQARSLLRELRSHVPHDVAKKRKNTCVKGPRSGPHFPRQSPTARPLCSALLLCLPASVSTQCPPCLCRQGRSSNGLRSVPLSPGLGAEPGRGLLPKPCQPEDLFTE